MPFGPEYRSIYRWWDEKPRIIIDRLSSEGEITRIITEHRWKPHLNGAFTSLPCPNGHRTTVGKVVRVSANESKVGSLCCMSCAMEGAIIHEWDTQGADIVIPNNLLR